MNADRKNSFAVLEIAEEIIVKDEEQKNETTSEREEQIAHLRQPLIWIDLEMTGKSALFYHFHA